MIAGSLFSGVGGLDLGLARAGYDHAFFAEWDEWRREVLESHWPGVPIYSDVKEVAMPRGEPWNKGRTYTMAKRENYANKGAWNLAMRRMFASACMRCGWDEGPTDTHHIVAKRDGGPMTLDNGVILCPNCHRLADIEAISVEELRALRAAAPVTGVQAGVVVSSEAPQIDVLCGGFPLRAKTSQSPASEPDSPDLDQDSFTSSFGSQTLFDHDGSCSRTSAAYYRRTTGETWESLSVRWPTSGTASRGEFSTHATSESPSDAVECSLSDILEATTSSRYELSAKAAAGILRRAVVRGREIPAGLLEALEGLSRTR